MGVLRQELRGLLRRSGESDGQYITRVNAYLTQKDLSTANFLASVRAAEAGLIPPINQQIADRIGGAIELVAPNPDAASQAGATLYHLTSAPLATSH